MASRRQVPLLTLVRQLLIPTPMARVGLFFLAEDAPHVVSVLARLGACQVARLPSELEDYLEPCFPSAFRDAYHRLRQPYEPLAQRWELVGQGALASVPHRVPTIDEMNRLAERLEALAGHVDEITHRIRQLQQRQLELEHFDDYLRVLAELDIDVRALSDLRFLHVRAGTVPEENVNRLRESAELSGDMVLNLGVRGERAHVLVVGVGGVSSDLEGLLAKAHFQTHPTPAFAAAGDSPNIAAQIENELTSSALQFKQLAADERELRNQHCDTLLEAGTVVMRAAVFVECESILEGQAHVAFLNGWVPQNRVQAVRQALANEVSNPVVMIEQPPRDHTLQAGAPSELAVPSLFRPVIQLVSLYGSPGYSELNPMLVIAATTPLFFGMMFGDVGHGLLLLLATIALRRWLRSWVVFGVSCGVGAIIFGLLYGSVFGVEHWLAPLWMRPMDDPFRLLAVALWMGVVFVLLTFVLKAANLLRQGEWLTAIIGLPGLGGAAFYLGAVLLAQSLYVGQRVPPLVTALSLAGLLLIGWHTALEIRRQGRSVVADLVSEYFHTLLALFTNTLSFLRLAAFALAHAALSIATFLVMDTIPPTVLGWVFRAVVFLLGTLIILVLDGLAVGIQTIRLQFYEGLARYYRGDGQLFRPLRFDQDWESQSFQPS